MCTVVYIEVEKDVCGWWIGYHDAHFPSAFFKLENFYSTENPTFLATEGTDIYGGWKLNFSSSQPKIDKPVMVEENLCHKLDQLQDAYAAEWMFFSTDPNNEAEMAAYHQNELPVQDANIKFKKLNKLNKDDVIWTYASNDLDMRVIEYMMPRWPLDYGKI